MERLESPGRGMITTVALVTSVELNVIYWLLETRQYLAAGLASVLLFTLDCVAIHPNWDLALIIRREGDERQVRVTDRSARTAFLVVLAVCLFGSTVELGIQRSPGAFSLIGWLAGAVYLLSVVVLMRRS